MSSKVQNKRWTDGEFFEKRKEVLTRWPTGKDLEELDKAVAYGKSQPDTKNFAKKLAKGKTLGQILAEPGTGIANVNEVMAHMKYVAEAGADFFLLHTDSYTRSGKYDLAQRGMEESEATGRSQLNGLPIVNVGLEKLRKVNESLKIPIRVVGSPDQDTELNAEMGLASGFLATPSYTLHCVAQHCRDYPLSKRTQVQQYINRLAGYYIERDVPVELTIVGCVNGWTPPSVLLATVVIDSIIAAEQGGTHQSVGTGLQLNMVQDVAQLGAVTELVSEYLVKLGYKVAKTPIPASKDEVVLSRWIWSWMGDWPEDISQAAGMVGLCATTAAMAKCDWTVVKSVQEAIGVPAKEANAAGVKMAKQIYRLLKNQDLLSDQAVLAEKEWIKKETRAIVDRVLELGDGDVVVGQMKAVEEGVLDFPFSPYMPLKAKVLGARDLQGAIRYLQTGNLPFSKDIIEYNREKLAEREKAEGRKVDLNMIAGDFCVRSEPIGASVL